MEIQGINIALGFQEKANEWVRQHIDCDLAVTAHWDGESAEIEVICTYHEE